MNGCSVNEFELTVVMVADFVFLMNLVYPVQTGMEARLAICEIIYLNGVWVSKGKAMISPFDRGFLFAHAAYEVTAVFGGALIDFEGHANRLGRTLNGLGLENPFSLEAWRTLHQDLVARNAMTEGLIYLQVTAGAYDARDFAGPETYRPTILAWADERELLDKKARQGIRAISLEDTRWARRDMKTTQLLSQALAYRAARDAGADTAFMVEDGLITEAASANVWMVTPAGALVTRALSNAILGGITRERVIAEVAKAGLTMEERSFSVDEALKAAELFTTSAGALIAPVVSLDGVTIGNGTPGPITRYVQELYYANMGASEKAIMGICVG